jgi:hypothetical protein
MNLSDEVLELRREIDELLRRARNASDPETRRTLDAQRESHEARLAKLVPPKIDPSAPVMPPE